MKGNEARVSLAFLGLMLLGSLLCPWVLPDPQRLDPLAPLAAPSAAHLLGTDALGRDVLARVLIGARGTLALALVATAISSTFGALLGLAAGYLGGTFERGVVALVDLTSAVPRLPVMLLLASMPVAAAEVRLGLAMIAFSWLTEARLARAGAQGLIHAGFVESARLLGLSPWRVLTRHVAPNVAGPILVAATMSLGELILSETVLSFLGLGLPPPTPSWGGMLAQGISGLSRAPWSVLGPGALIFLTIVAVQRVGDHLALALDPRTRTR